MPLLQIQSSNDIHNRVGSIGHHFFEESKDIDLLQGSRWQLFARLKLSKCCFFFNQVVAMVSTNVSVWHCNFKQVRTNLKLLKCCYFFNQRQWYSQTCRFGWASLLGRRFATSEQPSDLLHMYRALTLVALCCSPRSTNVRTGRFCPKIMISFSS